MREGKRGARGRNSGSSTRWEGVRAAGEGMSGKGRTKKLLLKVVIFIHSPFRA